MDYRGPFIGTEALTAGAVTRHALSSRYSKIHRNVYIAEGSTLTARDRALAAWLWSGRQATLAGLSAAAMPSSKWIDPHHPAEIVRAEGHAPDGILIHRDALPDDEVCSVAGIRVTTPARTAFDLGRRGDFEDAVVRVDALAAATGVKPDDVTALTAAHPGTRGLVQLRGVLDVMDGGAESPPETRTRLTLIDGGLPKPETQIVVRNQFGYPFARIDMGYREFKVGVEYDGAQHWTDPKIREGDIDRHAELLALGWLIVKVSAGMLQWRRPVIVARTCESLRQAGAQWPVIARVLRDRVA